MPDDEQPTTQNVNLWASMLLRYGVDPDTYQTEIFGNRIADRMRSLDDGLAKPALISAALALV